MDYNLFKLIAGRESSVLGELDSLLTAERAAHFAINLSSSQQKCSVLIDTSQAGIIFSSVSVSVNLCNLKLIKN